MNRRGFLQAILASAVAPWVITKAGVLMPGRGVTVPRFLWHPPSAALLAGFDSYAYHRGGKTWFFAQEALRRARANPEGKIAILSGNVEPTHSLLEMLAGPAGVPTNLIHLPQPRGKI